MARYINVDSALQAHPEFLNEQIDDHDKAVYAKGWNACNKEYYNAITELPVASMACTDLSTRLRRAFEADELVNQRLLLDAADAIEELLARDVVPTDFHERCLQLEIRKRIELEKQMPHWISVEERLPEGNGTRYEYDLEESNLVLVYGINHIGEMAYGLGRYIYDHDDPKDSGWNGNMDCDYDLDYCTVTHWMPLPEAPKEERTDDDA